jgi:hypothetical protein
MRMRLLSFALAALVAAPLAGQGKPVPTSITGTVRDSAGHAVAGAELTIAGTPLRGESNENGQYRMVGVPAGMMTVRVRRLGFRPATAEVTIAEGTESKLDLTVRPSAQALAPVVVRGVNRQYKGRMADFYQRRDMGFGRFITRAQIEQRNPLKFTDLLRGLPGITTHPTSYGRTFVRVRGSRCPPQVVIDGMAVNSGNEFELDDLHPMTVEGIEVYTGAGIPVEYQSGTVSCGLIVVWSRIGELRPKKRASAAISLAQLVEALKIYTADQVDSVARPRHNEAPDPHYPNQLLQLSRSEAPPLEGDQFAFVEFVVDTAGKADMDAFSAISATHPLFVDAVREALPRARWFPAIRQGRKVRQVIQQRFDFQRGKQ